MGPNGVEDVLLETGRESHLVVLEVAVGVVQQHSIIVGREVVVVEEREQGTSRREPTHLWSSELTVQHTLPGMQVESIRALACRGCWIQKQGKPRRERPFGAKDAEGLDNLAPIVRRLVSFSMAIVAPSPSRYVVAAGEDAWRNSLSLFSSVLRNLAFSARIC